MRSWCGGVYSGYFDFRGEPKKALVGIHGELFDTNDNFL